MYNLGNLLTGKRDLEGALVWYERAAETGHVKAMGEVGTLLKLKSDFDGAAVWYQRAADAGSTYASQALAGLRRKIEFSDRQLDSLTFETFGWQMTQNDDGVRIWSSEEGSLAERFFEMAPDFESLDPDEIREAMIEFQGFLESPSFSLEEDIPEQLRRYFPAELPEQVSPLEIECFEILPAKCVLIENRHRIHDHVHYSTGIMILFADRIWALGLEVEEDQIVGEREGAVARHLLEGNVEEALGEEFNPYDRRWDGLVALEDDPLTRMRVLVAQLRASITLGNTLLDLEPFEPSGGQ